MALPAAVLTQSERMPIALEILFSTIAIVLLLVSSGVSWRYRRAWKNNRDRNPRAPFRLPLAKNLELSLYTLGALICFAATMSNWRFRASFGGIALLGVMLTIYRLKSGAKSTPNFDEASVLHVGPTGTRAPSPNS
jgi:hypothetical protein